MGVLLEKGAGRSERTGRASQQKEQYVLRLGGVAHIGQETEALQDGNGRSRSHIRQRHQCQAEPVGLTLRMREQIAESDPGGDEAVVVQETSATSEHPCGF